MSGLNEFDLRGAQADYVCMFPATGSDYIRADLGKPVVLVNDSGIAKAGRGANGDAVYGKIHVINQLKNDWNSGNNIAGDNDEITIQNKGFAEFAYDPAGLAPVVGGSIMISAVAGLVEGVAAPTAIYKHIVHKVDAAAKTCVVELK